ncbi:MAG: RNA polymerase sigma factor RpoH, partial [uncultured Sphingomonadaceae bacterium]
GSQISRHDPRRGRRSRAQPVPIRNQEIPDPRARGGVYAGQALDRAWRHGRGGEARQLAPSPRRQDLHGLSRLRPARVRAYLGRQYRPDAGREEVRARARLPPRDLCDVVDQGLDPGVHPAQLVAREDGHHRGAEEAVLQPSPDEEQDRRVRGRRHAPGGRDQDRHRSRRHRSRRHLDEPPHGARRRHVAQRPLARGGRGRVAGLARRLRPVAGRAHRGRRGEAGASRVADRGDGRAERPREVHPDRAAVGGRPQDAGGAQPGLRRQPRAHPPDRGARVREAAEVADQHRGRAAAASGRRL